MDKEELCLLKDIEDNGAAGMIARVSGKQRNIFVVRQGEDIHAYVNWCPHNQVLIDQIPGQFFNGDKTMLRCSKHDALFQINDGLCVEGPCVGENLQALRSHVENGVIYLEDGV